MKLREGFLKGLGIGTLTGVCFGLGGFFLAASPKTAGMGSVLFLMVPFSAGFAIALVSDFENAVWIASTLATLGSLAMLVAFGREGFLCALLSLPILAVGLVIGSLAGFLVRRYIIKRFDHPGSSTFILLLLAPIVIAGSRRVELPSLENPRHETVTSVMLVPAAPDEVWKNIESIDRIDTKKPLLMYFGLPVPVRCTLEGKGVGAKRTCYFNNGSIQETVTEWKPPYSMRLTIDRTNMPGRHWLGFEDALYELRPAGSGTEVTRTTTFTSHLAPVWYWRYFERLGIQSEHEYILHDLANRVVPQ